MNSFNEHILSRVGVRKIDLVARDGLFEAIYGVTVYCTLWYIVPVFVLGRNKYLYVCIYSTYF